MESSSLDSPPHEVSTLQDPVTPTISFPFPCQEIDCSQGFVSHSKLLRHIHHRHNPFKLSCSHSKCDFQCGKIQDMTSHTRSCHPFVCSLCFKSFPIKSRLESHVKVHLTLRLNFPCSHAQCPKVLSSQSNLQSHLREVHFKTPRFPCFVNGCEFIFTRKGQLKIHLKRIHDLKLPESSTLLSPSLPLSYSESMFSNLTTLPSATLHSKLIDSTPLDSRSGPSIPSLTLFKAKSIVETNLEPHAESTFDTLPLDSPFHDSSHNETDIIPTKSTTTKRSTFMDQDSFHVKFKIQSSSSPNLPPSPSLSPSSTTTPPPTPPPDVMNELTGMVYANPEKSGRHVTCTVPGCLYRFKRLYDLHRHLISGHSTIFSLATQDSLSAQDSLSTQEK